MDTTVDHFTPLALRVRGNKKIVILLFVARYTIAYSMNGILQMKSS